MVIIQRGLFTQAPPTRPLLSTFEEFLVEEEQAKEAALKEAIEAAHEKVIDDKAGGKGKKECPGTHVATGSNSEKGSQYNPLVFLMVLKDKVEVRIEQMEKTLAINTISASTIQMRIKNLERAWSEFKAQYHRLRIIAGRGRLLGLQAYHTTLQRCCVEVHARAEDALEEEQAKEAALKKEAVYQQKITAWKQTAQAKADAKKAKEKAEKKKATRTLSRIGLI